MKVHGWVHPFSLTTTVELSSSLLFLFITPDDESLGGGGSSKKGKKVGKRVGNGVMKKKLRGGSTGARGPRSFTRLLEDVSFNLYFHA